MAYLLVGECVVGLFTLRGAGGAIWYISEGYLRRFMLVSLRSSRLGLTLEEIITSMFPFSLGPTFSLQHSI
jgi:hypothetical protein